MFIVNPKQYRTGLRTFKISNGVNYQEVVKELEKRERFGFLFGLERIAKFLKKLGYPERNLQVIHITGTNGKGSTAAFIAKILEFAGYQVGLYTSPHLLDIRERVQINSQPISKKDFLFLFKKLSEISPSLFTKLTYFEFLTALAFQYFFIKRIDFLILEVGMGGRFDATNVIPKPLVSVITNIDYEHTQYLGKTLTKIAYEKAGIIKKNSFTVTGVKQKNVLSLFKKICAQRKNRLFFLGEDFLVKYLAAKPMKHKFQVFNYQGIFQNYENLKIKLLGEYQIENAALALATIEILRLNNIFISEQAIREGLENTSWPGRFEICKLIIHPCLTCAGVTPVPAIPVQASQVQAGAGIGRSLERRYPSFITVLLDGAHNPAGIRTLKENLSCLKGKKIFAILGILADKNISQMMKEICPVIDEALLTKPTYYRAAEPGVLFPQLEPYLRKEKIFLKPTVKEALNFAFSKVNNKDTLLLVTGSLYTVGEAKKIILQWKRKKQLILA